jgi:hypothetical protein
MDWVTVASVAEKLTVTGGVLFILIASYMGKFWWSWQVKGALEEKDKVITDKDKRITELQTDCKDRIDRAEVEVIYWRDSTMAALGVGGQIAEVAKRRTRV